MPVTPNAAGVDIRDKAPGDILRLALGPVLNLVVRPSKSRSELREHDEIQVLTAPRYSTRPASPPARSTPTR